MSRDLHMRTAWVQTHPIESLTIRVERALEAAWISPLISSLNDVWLSSLCSASKESWNVASICWQFLSNRPRRWHWWLWKALLIQVSSAQKVASVMRMESSAISWPPSRNGSNWRYSGQYGILLDASRGMMSRNPPNLFPSFIPFPRTAFDVLNRSEIKVLCEKSVIDF